MSNYFSITMDSPERFASSRSAGRLLLDACMVALCITAPIAAQDSFGLRTIDGFGLQTMDPIGQLAVDAFALEPVDIGAPIRNAPFSAEATTELVQTLSDGNRIVRRTSASLHRDSRGRTRREVTLEAIAGIIVGGGPLHMITISDPDSGLTYMADSRGQLRTVRAGPGPPRAGPIPTPGFAVSGGLQQPRPTTNLEREEPLGTHEIEGVLCEGTRTTVTIPAGAIGNERAIESVTERWVSPELRVVVLSRRSDPRFGETTYRLTNITRAEPPADLFALPAP
jgi:hypothetical protein